MVLDQEWQLKPEDNLSLVEEPKEERLFQHNISMVKLESLKKSYQFKKALKEKKFHTDFFSVFATKNFYKPKYRSNLLISLSFDFYFIKTLFH